MKPGAERDAVVIGAGLAGLAAAVTLARAGLSVEVLEARERVGGRVLTLREPFDDGLYAEAGPEFISPGHAVVRRFLREFGLKLSPRSPGPRLLYFNGRAQRGWWVDDYGELARREVHRVAAATASLCAAVADPERPWEAAGATELDARSLGSWLDALRLDPLVRAFWQTWVTIDYGVEPESLSLLMYARDERLIELAPERGPEHLRHGVERLPLAMAADLGQRVRLGARVTALDQHERAVTVTYEQASATGTLSARHAVVALPLGVLRDVPIRPALEPGHRQALEGLRYGHVTKVHLQFRRRFWEEDAPVRGVMTDLPLQSAWDSTHAQPGPRGILSMYVAGRSAVQLAGLPIEQRVARCLEQLERLFPGCVDDYERGASVDWDGDPAARGAYSHFGPAELTRYGPWLARPFGRLHFAGEHTDHWQATMNGALNSGVRAAREILASA